MPTYYLTIYKYIMNKKILKSLWLLPLFSLVCTVNSCSSDGDEPFLASSSTPERLVDSESGIPRLRASSEITTTVDNPRILLGKYSFPCPYGAKTIELYGEWTYYGFGQPAHYAVDYKFNKHANCDCSNNMSFRTGDELVESSSTHKKYSSRNTVVTASSRPKGGSVTSFEKFFTSTLTVYANNSNKVLTAEETPTWGQMD